MTSFEMKANSKNYYEVLEAPVDSSQEEVHDAYTRAKNAYSGNSIALYSLMTEDECNSILEMVEEAYCILGDPNRRAEYDRARGFNQARPLQKSENSFSGKAGDKTAKESIKTEEANTLGLRQEIDKEKVSKNDFTINKNDNEVSKVSAKTRFSLSYDENQEFEEEIENATEYSGEFLKKIREYKNVDVHRMADMTKISKTYITNIEAEDFENLPAPVYVRGFVYQYAKTLKLNPDLVASSFTQRYKSYRENKV